MKINTKIKLKTITLSQIEEAISQLHHIEATTKRIEISELKRIIKLENIIAYQISQNGVYEYIYSLETNELYIHIESNSKTCEMMDYLIKNDWIDSTYFLHVTNKPLKITDPKTIICNEGKFPMIYLHQNDYSERLYNQLSAKLKGMAYVIYGNELLDEIVCQHYQIKQKSFAILFNKDLLDINYSNGQELVDMMISRIERYMSQRVYDYPFSFKKLQKHVLMDMLHETAQRENQKMFEHNAILNDLQVKQLELIKKIEKIESEIDNLNHLIENSKAQLIDKTWCPILFKGKENDLYPNEQKDVLIAILKEEYERIKNSKSYDREKEIIVKLLELNPESGVRTKYLLELQNTLEPITRSINDKELAQLKRLGIDLIKGQKHYKGYFCGDSRYTVTISTSASDENAGHQLYRDIRNEYF